VKRSALTLAIVAVAAPVIAADSYTIDSRHTWPVFEINHLGFSTQRGRFNKTTGKIILDLAAKQGSIDIAVDTASIDMGLEDWDKHMKSDEFFNVEKFPTMAFKADRLAFDGDRLIGADGNLTLLGVTKPVRLSVSNFRCGTHPLNKKAVCGADVATVIKRSEFGMTKSLPAVGDLVKVTVPVEAFKD
jgi:polyisoprenoid-binding protein YceI